MKAGGKRMRMEVIVNGRSVPKELQKGVLLDATARIRERQEMTRFQRRVARLADHPERLSVQRAMLAVEERMVKAFWTIARLPGQGLTSLGRCGISYVHDVTDVHARYADAAGGKWDTIAPRPALPSSKDIDAANNALDWLLLIDDEKLRKLFVVGATSKRGDPGRNINWLRVRMALREYEQTPARSLKWRYQTALRTIVTELTLARVA